MLKYAVLGAAGQLGRDLCPRLCGEVVPLQRQDADLTDPDRLRSVLTELQPAYVINCAAYNLVDRAESEPEVAFATNTWAIRNLALICRDLDCTLVHFSSDYVFGFDTSRKTPYHEDEAPGPVSVYGLSKLAGEYLVRSLCPNHLVIRTCGLYGVWGSGGKGGNFVETMVRLASQGKPLRVVADQTCTPSYTVDVATVTAGLIESRLFGLYHLTNSGSCSWYEFARTIFELQDIRADLKPITSKEFGAPARRPGYSVLRSRVSELRPWPEALAAYLQERQKKTL